MIRRLKKDKNNKRKTRKIYNKRDMKRLENNMEK